MVTWWILWRVPLFLLVVMAGWWFTIRPATPQKGWVAVEQSFALCGSGSSGAFGCVADGDTVIIGFGPQQRRIRFTGFDTPELNGACTAERELAGKARLALHDWLTRGTFEWSGADNPPRDQYGRELRAVRRVSGKDDSEYLAETMISQGLASETGWGSTPRNWCA